jgi:hypothetical protein
MRTTIPITGPAEVQNGTKLVYESPVAMPDGHVGSYWLVSEKKMDDTFLLTYHYGNVKQYGQATTRVGRYSLGSLGSSMHRLVTELAYDPNQQGDRDDDI